MKKSDKIQKAIDIIEATPADNLVSEKYFTDKQVTKDCPACVIGKLLVNLPEEKFNDLLPVFLDNMGERMFYIEGERPGTFTAFEEVFGLIDTQLGCLQRLNDHYDNDSDEENQIDRKKSLLDQLRTYQRGATNDEA